MTIALTRYNTVATLTISRPEVLNALRTQELESIRQILEEVCSDDGARAIVITGLGRAFSVGSDIKAMDGMSAEDFATQTAEFQSLARAFRDCPLPIIAALNGLTIGGGLEIALMADVRLAAESASFSLPDAELGFSPSGGTTWLLPRIIGTGRAMHLLLSGESLSARRAEEVGLVTGVYPDDELMDRAAELAQKISSWPPTGIANIKTGVHEALDQEFDRILAAEARRDSESFADPETKLRLAAFLESRRKRKNSE